MSKVNPLFRLVLLGVDGTAADSELELDVLGVALGGLLTRELEEDVTESSCERKRISLLLIPTSSMQL